MRRATARCSSSRSRIAAPKVPTTNASSSSAIRCSTCCCPNGCTANFPMASEGDLSRLRARLVSEEPLAEIAQAMQLGELLLLGSGELKTGGFRRQSILADAFEALCGALYLDGGLEAVRAHDRPDVRGAHRRAARTVRRSRMPRRACRNICRPTAARCRCTPSSAPAASRMRRPSWSPAPCRTPALETEGEGPSRRRAEQVAAQAALHALGFMTEEAHPARTDRHISRGFRRARRPAQRRQVDAAQRAGRRKAFHRHLAPADHAPSRARRAQSARACRSPSSIRRDCISARSARSIAP